MGNINIAWQWAVNTCNASNVGYSQAYRTQSTVNGITYYDCSSFIWYSLLAGGFDVVTANGGSNYPITTSGECAWLLALGFTEININSAWLPGDIVWRSGHTEMVYSGGDASGVTMGAHTDGVALANQVSINNTPSTSSYYTRLFRCGDGGATGYGYSLSVISAICGNWWGESNINPGIWESLIVGNYGYGLGQWTDNSETDRRTRLTNWLSDNGYAMDSGHGQMEYFIHENTWYQTGYASNYSALTEFLGSTSTDLRHLTLAFMQGWEGILDGTQNTRVEHAQTCYNYISAHANDTSITDWITGNRYLAQAEILNNAVMVYRFLSAGGGGGGTAHAKKKMPLWMKLKFYV